MVQHGINTYRERTPSVAVTTGTVGVTFFIGAWPCHSAKGFTGKPQLVTTFPEAKKLGGYSDEWRTTDGKPKWTLCQAAYAQFNLFAMSPAIFYNVFDPSKHKKAMEAADYAIKDHKAEMSLDTIDSDTLVVKNGETILTKGTDFTTYYTDTAFCIELIESSTAYSATTLSVACDSADVSKITATDIEAAVEAVEMCRSVVGIVPDLICAPGWSSVPAVAAVMAAKAPSINGVYRAKAVVDLDSSATGADEYTDVYDTKIANGYNSEDMIVCWPMVKNNDKIFDLSTIVCGLIATIDSGNDNCPYESPSNKSVPITGAVNAAGTEITITTPIADVLSVTDGVVTVLNDGGWVLWGNYMGCYPTDKDVARIFICTSRVQDWLCNRFVDMCRQYIDQPLTPIMRDAIINTYNAWLNGLTADGKLYGGEVVYLPENNGTEGLLGGAIRLDATSASPVPMQRIDLHAVFSAEMLETALDG